MSKYGNLYGSEEYGSSEGVILEVGGLPYIGHQFYVGTLATLCEVSPQNVWNEFDEHGLSIGLSRTTGETNWSYKRRILDVFAHRANSTYRGLVNGVTRELGFSLFSPLSIDPKIGDNGDFLAPDPYIKFDGAFLYLYSDYQNGLLDYKIDRFEAGGNYEHLSRLVDFINSTAFFEANLLESGEPFSRTMTIINQSNRLLIDQPTQPSTRFKLNYEHLVRGSIIFSDQDTFQSEKSTSAQVVSMGQYHIDYVNGIVTVFSIPPLESRIRYQVVDYPFKPLASPVILCDINSQNFKAKMFNQLLQEDGTYINGVPLELGTDIINELLAVTPMYWGI